MNERKQFYENPRSEENRKKKSNAFATVCLLIASLAVVILVTLIGSIVASGGNWLSWELLTGVHREDNPEGSGIGQAIAGSLVLCFICGAVALPVGIGTALFLEEFKPTNRIVGWLHSLVQLNINNLAGVPSIVYGILGLTAFVYMFGLIEPIQANNPPSIEIGATYFYQTKTLGGKWVTFPAEDPEQTILKINEPVEVTMPSGEIVMLNVLPKSEPSPRDDAVRDVTVFEGANASTFRKNSPIHFHLPFSKSVLSAGLTLALVILPIVIIASQEALRAVPDSLREASLGLGATRWQTVRGTVLPAAIPGIMTGAILSMSRAVGEAAPIIAVMGSVAGTTTGLTSLMDKSPVLPVMIFRWAGEENPGFEHLSAAAIIVLLVFLLIMNSIAILIRYRHEKKQS
ncbi:MAG: PstA family ABC transporter permease [Planctomycetota bacterium]